MLRVHDIEGIEAGAHINGKEIKIRTKTGTQEEGKRGMGKDIIVIKEESKKYESSVCACIKCAYAMITNMLILQLKLL